MIDLARVRAAQRVLATAKAEDRTNALSALADVMRESDAALEAANQQDLAAAESLEPQLKSRLALGAKKRAGLIDGLKQLAGWDDPIGQKLHATKLDDGLVLTKVQSPIGVILVIFESRPDAVIQIASLAIRSGNAVVLKGGSEANHSNRALVACVRTALTRAGLDPEAVILVEGRAAVHELLSRGDALDLVIPRGSGQLVRSIQEGTRIPVLGHAEGICHLYIDAKADPTMATQLAVDGKCDYPAACNATETILVHEAFVPYIADVAKALHDKGVELRVDAKLASLLPYAKAATEDDFHTEYGALIVNMKVVSDVSAAIAHIAQYGSAHTDAIVTSDPVAAERFMREVDSASVFHNASTRFADGYRYGLGAEVGVSTSRIHARGPVGVEGLLTTRWLLRGGGHIVGDYSSGAKQFKHERLK